MADENSKKDGANVYFIIVPRVGQKVMHTQVLVYQTRARSENGVQVENEATDVLTPDGQGLFVLNKAHPNHAARVTALTAKMKRENLTGKPPALLGPFDDYAEAFKAMHKARPKTDQEVVGEAVKELAAKDAALAAKEAENEELRKKLEAASAKK